MATSKALTGVKIRFVDQRKRSRSLAFQLFHAKKAGKDELYPPLLQCARVTLRQLTKAIDAVCTHTTDDVAAHRWVVDVGHYRSLLLKVINQTERRVFNGEPVPSSEKVDLNLRAGYASPRPASKAVKISEVRRHP